jgi:hypothetical protein
VISQLTDTVGTSVTDTAGDSYTSTVGTADSVADTASVSDTTGHSSGRGTARQDAFAPFGHVTGSRSTDSSQSYGTSDSRSITEGISSSTAWGISTSTAVGTSSSTARTSQRSREFLVEPHELQQLPPSAVIVSYASPEGRRVVLADANPAIIALRTSTLLSLEEALNVTDAGEPGYADGAAARPGDADGAAAQPGDEPGAGPAPEDGREAPPDTEPPPNLGPPPERLDWRKPR